MTYDEFINGKLARNLPEGFEPYPINPMLYDFQQTVERFAIKRGRAALFLECGLGKTPLQIEWARQVVLHTGKSVLIFCPLAVAAQTVSEGVKFGTKVTHVKTPEEMTEVGIYITNYERLDLFGPQMAKLGGVVLDESSILKSFTGKTRGKLTALCRDIPYRLCCTATPSPNDHTELGQHAEFLGIGTSGEMLATWFVNDTANTGTWRLKKHAKDDFWKWVASWAACVSKPSDIGFDDRDFILPPLEIIPVWVDVDEKSGREAEELFRMTELSAANMHKEMRLSCDQRAKVVADLVTASDEAWICWCNLNDESEALKAAIPDSVEVKGSDREEVKEKRLVDFSAGRVNRMISKSSICGFGMNWQHCHNVCYFPSYSFEDFYQAIRRCYRFGQKETVKVYVVLPKTAGAILRTINTKLHSHETMREAMKFSAKNMLGSHTKIVMKTTIDHKGTDRFTLYHGDCVRVAETLVTESIDFSVFSPPFADLFVYSSDVQDMGNCKTMDEFMSQFGYLVDNMFRVTKPGRLCAVHCVDLMAAKWKDGEIELKNFSGQIVDAFRDRDWLFHTRVTIWKDPVVEMQRTKALGLLHKQLLKDSCMSRVGSPEYVLVFRKPGINTDPVSHTREEFPVEQWQKDASPVWMDIHQGRVLNGEIARENSDERHICPLQLDVIERLLRLYTNPDDMVYSPFAGIGSEGYCSVKAGRRFVGSELKKSYFDLAVSYLKKAEDESRTLFNLVA